MKCTAVLHGGVCHHTSTRHKSGNMIERKKIPIVSNTVLFLFAIPKYSLNVINLLLVLQNGQPFDEANEAPWAKVATVLNAIYMLYLNTERRLTTEQLNYLANIALGK